MGADQSKSLNQFSKEDLANAVASLGSKYHIYADTIRENGVDGDFIASISAEEFSETITDLNIVNRLHVRILTKEWQAAREWKANDSMASGQETVENSNKQIETNSTNPIDKVDSDATDKKSNLFATMDSVDDEFCPDGVEEMERIFTLDLLGLKNIEYHDSLVVEMQSLADMAKSMFDMTAIINILDHDNSMYNFCASINLSDKEKSDALLKLLSPVVRKSENIPFARKSPRYLAACNNTITSKKTFTIFDLWAEKRFTDFKDIGLRFFSNTPVFWRDQVVATFCLVDDRLHPDFSEKQVLQQEQCAQLLSQYFDNWFLRQEMDKSERSMNRISLTMPKANPPSMAAAIVFTDVEGSTFLWESNHNAMHKALQIHDFTFRKAIAEYNGFEVNTEGDAFNVAFHDALDAVKFALKVQEALYEADWDTDILSLPKACPEAGCFKGLRVRMGIHFGPVTAEDNEVTRRRQYTGETVQIAKSLENMAHGGQILVSSDVWDAVSSLSESTLDSPQVIDLGMHILLPGDQEGESLTARSVLQLVPSRFAFDYNAVRSLAAINAADKLAVGRAFPPVITLTCLSKSFFDAPYKDNKVALLFLCTNEIEKEVEDCKLIVASLVESVNALTRKGLGYHCRDYMYAFDSLEDAVRFGLELQDILQSEKVLGNDLSGLLKVGIYEGEFTSMHPNKSTGRADYAGGVVYRAALVASQALPGKVCAGVRQGSHLPLPDCFIENFVGSKALENDEEMLSIYAISPQH